MGLNPHLFLRKFCTKPCNNLFVTTPIFYVNAAPHIGHLYSAVIADAAFRYNKLRQSCENEILSTGTDEHGMKVAQAASAQKVAVESYCKTISGEYRNVFDAAGIRYTDFIRTTEDRHKKSVSYFWNRLNDKGNIYSTKYSGWYCVSDETFVTDNQIKETPNGKVSVESGHAVEWTEEVNYMFRLGNLQDDVLHWVQKGNRIKPQKFEKILLDLLSEPLPDVSISRPKQRMQWGIDVPNDETQKVYVWLDALVNYLTCAGYPDKEFKTRWPPTLQVLGKDILKFHGVYWPAFLIAAGLEPPQQLLVHSHWTVDGQKMSKSKLNVVDPIERSQLFTMEGLRYFLLREGVVHNDGNYSNVKATRILNSELADTLGNLLSRACANSLNPRQVVPIIHETQFEELTKLDITQKLLEALSQTGDKCIEHYESYNFYLVVDQIISVLHLANNFFETCKPWELKNANKTTDSSRSIKSDDLQKLETIIAITLETLRVCGVILQPIIPGLTTQLLDKLSIPMDTRKWRHLEPFLWNNINENKEKSLAAKNAVLFRRILLDNNKAEQKKKAAI